MVILALESTFMTTEKHGFMFISGAVYNLMKFKFSLCRNHEKPETHRERNSRIRERVFEDLRRVKLATADDQKSFHDRHFTR